ncbi:addiction module protein [Arcobacter sp. FWKO B]|uniref:addiction module protein n=1 Tax=Arcobacter sp. FWKO B TaxID=2593672 RepID=UPI0018A418F6|nr:addiction module protein [Arcobacter sp. FWKO B]QOG12685.1 addiction module protein [Arcobacter sp. FWKO B]
MVAVNQQKLFEQIDFLPLELKTKIVDKILSSLNPVESSINDLWIKEVNQRKEDVLATNITLVTGDEVFTKISNRLK